MARVMVVDDKEENRYLLRVLLQGHGYEVNEACNGAEALEMVEQNPPDLIISDILMPVMDGFSLCRKCKKNARLGAIPFVFYTATYTDERDRVFALGLGADRFVIKPEEPEAFMKIIRETMQGIENPPGSRSGDNAEVLPESSAEEESTYLRQYNATLIRKLEVKMEQLKQANLILNQDIAKLKKAELVRQESERRFSIIFYKSPLSIVITRLRDNCCLDVNEAWVKTTGYSREEAIGHTPFELGLWLDLNERAQLIDQLRRKGTVSGFEMKLRKKSGEIANLLFYAELIELDGERCMISMVQDITERLRLEAQFLQAQKMEAIGVLAGGIAHDFNNLLNVINGYSEMLLGDIPENNPLRNDLEQIWKAGQSAASLTSQLLAFSRKQILQLEIVDLNEIVTDMSVMLRRMIGEDIELVTSANPNLGMITADPAQIQQIILNLAVNARDAMPKGGKLIIETDNADLDESYVCVHPPAKAGSYVMLAVCDNGIGMNSETQSRIFEPFFTTKGIRKGTGLGLSTVYGIVKQNDGFIWVYSEPGLGTTLKIYFPRTQARIQPTSGEDMAEPVSMGSGTILIVEDEAAVRALACRILRERGYRVLEASGGAEALPAAREYQEKIDLIITDVVMPGMSGIELVSQLKDIHPEIKALYISGYTNEAIIHHGILNSNVNFLQKPFSIEGLVRKVQSILNA